MYGIVWLQVLAPKVLTFSIILIKLQPPTQSPGACARELFCYCTIINFTNCTFFCIDSDRGVGSGGVGGGVEQDLLDITLRSKMTRTCA